MAVLLLASSAQLGRLGVRFSIASCAGAAVLLAPLLWSRDIGLPEPTALALLGALALSSVIARRLATRWVGGLALCGVALGTAAILAARSDYPTRIVIAGVPQVQVAAAARYQVLIAWPDGGREARRLFDPPVSWSSGGGDIRFHGAFQAPTQARPVVITAVMDRLVARATVVVTPGPADGYRVQPALATLPPEGTVRLTVALTDKWGNALKSGTDAWKPSCGTVTPDGTFTAPQVAPRFCYVAAVVGGKDVAESRIEVLPDPPVALVLKPAVLSLAPGQDVSLTAVGLDRFGNETGELDHVAWTASGGTVVEGRYRAPTISGSYEVSAAWSQSRATARVSVLPGAAASLNAAPGALSLVMGQVFRLPVVGRDGFGNALPTSAISWSVAPQALGTVNSEGVFTAGRTSGAGTITGTNGTNAVTFSVAVSCPPDGRITFDGVPYNARCPARGDVFADVGVGPQDLTRAAAAMDRMVGHIESQAGLAFRRRPSAFYAHDKDAYLADLRLVELCPQDVGI